MSTLSSQLEDAVAGGGARLLGGRLWLEMLLAGTGSAGCSGAVCTVVKSNRKTIDVCQNSAHIPSKFAISKYNCRA